MHCWVRVGGPPFCTTRITITITMPAADAYTALEPYISKRTLEFHHDKHHAKYVATANEMIKGDTELENATLEEIIIKSKGAWWWSWVVCLVWWDGGRSRPRQGSGAFWSSW
jgi:hypothetical protein